MAVRFVRVFPFVPPKRGGVCVFCVFSSDPHPGNLIRTPDGKLAILDFGLMTQITDNQKFGMIEAISHLVHRDYEGIGDDFKRLDFIPEEVFFILFSSILISAFAAQYIYIRVYKEKFLSWTRIFCGKMME